MANQKKVLVIGEPTLTLKEVREAAFNGENLRLEIAPAALKRVKRSREHLLSSISDGKVIYGVNTGFGMFSNVRVRDDQIKELQLNLIRSHAVGVGERLPDQAVRVILLLRAHALALGYSGVSEGLIRALMELFNRGVYPEIPMQGSVGASGDLAPLAHLSLVLVGEGKARVGGKLMSGTQALKTAGLKPFTLGPKEGLALINGTQFMASLGAINLIHSMHLCDVADFAGAMTVEASRGTETAFEPEIHEVRPHPGQIYTAARMRKILLGSDKIAQGKKSGIAKSHENCGKVQDPYSLRCIPQVHGPIRDTLEFVKGILEREFNSVTDNPLVFFRGNKGIVLSGGNFHGQALAMAMDYLSISISELASISEQRIEKLINPVISELPAFLTKQGGLNSGFMIVQVAAASLVSENKTLSHPASVDTIPTSADKEDHVSMGAWAAVKCGKILDNARKVVAMELLSAAQGIDLLRPLKSSAALEKLHGEIRKGAKRLDKDRVMYPDIEFVDQALKEFKWEKWVIL